MTDQERRVLDACRTWARMKLFAGYIDSDGQKLIQEEMLTALLRQAELLVVNDAFGAAVIAQKESQTPTTALTLQPMAGSDIADVSADACRIANMLHVYVDFDFNGIPLFSRPKDKASDVIQRYHNAKEEVEVKTSPNDVEWDYCPHCYGRFAFATPDEGKCPHCGKILEENK